MSQEICQQEIFNEVFSEIVCGAGCGKMAVHFVRKTEAGKFVEDNQAYLVDKLGFLIYYSDYRGDDCIAVSWKHIEEKECLFDGYYNDLTAEKTYVKAIYAIKRREFLKKISSNQTIVIIKKEDIAMYLVYLENKLLINNLGFAIKEEADRVTIEY